MDTLIYIPRPQSANHFTDGCKEQSWMVQNPSLFPEVFPVLQQRSYAVHTKAHNSFLCLQAWVCSLKKVLHFREVLQTAELLHLYFQKWSPPWATVML